MAINYKGGHCQLCGYDRCPEALEFHHLESSGKDFGISNKGYTKSWNKVKKELDKCILLCANCHREVHSRLQLLRGIVDEKLGEIRETCPLLEAENGNPEPSPERLLFEEGAETRVSARTPDRLRGKRPTPYL